TLNEPWVVAHVGYRDGRHAPGIRDAAQAVAANHHLLLAHGRAVAALRASSAAGDIGITLNLTVERPVTPEAAGHTAELEARQNGVYLDPIFRGRYPELLDGNAAYSPAAAGGLVRDGDFGVIGAPLDFLGVNFYSPHYVGLLRPDGERPRHGFHPARGTADHRDELAGRAELHPRAADAGRRAGDGRAARLHHGERVGLARLPHAGRPGARPRADLLPAWPPGRAARGDRRRRAAQGVLRLVAA